MSNDQLLTTAITELNASVRELRGEVSGLRSDLADTRVTVALMQGAQQGESAAVEKRGQADEDSHRAKALRVEITAAAGVILGAVAAFAALVH